MLKSVKPWLILGAGSWGTALAIHLARDEQPVFLWSYDHEHAGQMALARVNERYLPGIAFPPMLSISAVLSEVAPQVEQVLIAVPSIGFSSVLSELKKANWQGGAILCATKGFALDGGWLHELVEDEFPGVPYAILSGPSFAKEVALAQPTAVTIASRDADWARLCQRLFMQSTFRAYTSDDIVGVQLGAVAKNVLAIAVGVSDGLQYGANARAALITRGLSEMMRLGQALGAEPDTLMGLSGLGDLVLTATDNQSRNRRFGLALGQGFSVQEACRQIGHVVEGIQNVAHLWALSQRLEIESPIIEQVSSLLLGKTTPEAATKALLWRPIGVE